MQMEQQDQQRNNNMALNNTQTFKVKGMKTDLSESSFDNSFAYENKNVRINVVDEDNTLMNLTNERGTKFVGNVKGIPIGIKKYDFNKALLFTTENTGTFDIEEDEIKQDSDFDIVNFSESDSNLINISNINFKDYIYILNEINKKINISNILERSLGFSAFHPLEIETYKDGDKNNFYLADGINNLKSFILNENNTIESSNENLDYTCKINGDEYIYNVTTFKDSQGEFFSGVIMYCFCYVTKQGHKTNIIDISNLVYLTNYNLGYGLAPNKRCNVATKIIIRNTSTNFDSIEVYSLFRSTLDGEITVRKVTTKKTQIAQIEITDHNKGELISYQELLSRFNSELIPSTFTQKSSTLFLGDIKTNNYKNLTDIIPLAKNSNYVELLKKSDDFLDNNQYFYGIQLQDRYGNWSPVMYAGTNSLVDKINLSTNFQKECINNGYIAARAMMLDNQRIRNTICEGLLINTYNIYDGKYGIDYYSPYFVDVEPTDIWFKDSKRIWENSGFNFSDLYSPDIEFNENFILDKSSSYNFHYKKLNYSLQNEKVNITIKGNTGILYNNESNDLGKVKIVNDSFGHYYLWKDALTKYQKALQILFYDNSNGESDEDNQNCVSSLYKLNTINIKEEPTEYKIYVWQPSGSLNDSDGRTSVLNYKRISRKYKFYNNDTEFAKYIYVNCYLFDGTTNNIPIGTNLSVYAGIVNQKLYPMSWSIVEKYKDANAIGRNTFWDEEQQQSQCDNYSLAILDNYNFIGQPVEIKYSFPGMLLSSYYIHANGFYNTYEIPALAKAYEENSSLRYVTKATVRVFRGTNGTSLGYKSLYETISHYLFDWDNEFAGLEYGWSDSDGYNDGERIHHEFLGKSIVKIRCSNTFNRDGNINIAYKTPKHLVIQANKEPGIARILNSNVSEYILDNNAIETGQWIVCSKKHKLYYNTSIDLNVNLIERYKWNPYECLKTEPYSLNDENQVTCIVSVDGINSYINPYCRYDNLRNMSDYNGITSAVFNKMNMVYNQKNNFFIFPGITEETITDDSLENTILYSDAKVANEKNDSFVNFSNTNFFTINSEIDKINKLITFNDKLLCFSNTALVQILYDENVVINTDSVQSLGLASTDKITGSQLITNSYGCMNKWSIGIFGNALFFNDDLNRKIIAFSNDFTVLNESLNIENLNSKLLKNKVWNPVSFENTKINIDKYSKDIHYTGNDIDIAFNQTIGNYTSLYSYENIPYIDTLGEFSIAIRNINKNNSEVHILRQGDYNYFFGKYEPYWTTVIMNQNSLINKMLLNVEFSTEAYDNSLAPIQNYTFDTLTFWNDYQSNKMKVDYKMYGQSLLKKKFRIWRVNRFRNNTKMINRNYDMISNTWNYLKFSSETENNNKLTLHWININYK